MFPILQIGPLAIQTLGLILLLGLWLGLTLSERFCPQRGIHPNNLYNLVFTGLIVGIIGGRILYFLRFPSAFTNSPKSIFSLNPGLFVLEDGIILGAIGMWAYAYRSKMKFWETLDSISPAVAVLGVSIGFSHIASGLAFGAKTELPWGIQLWGAQRHPTQILETACAILILAILWPGRKAVGRWTAGIYFINLICLTAASRLFLEALRGDSSTFAGGYRVAQVIAWLVLLGAVSIRFHLQNSSNQSLSQAD